MEIQGPEPVVYQIAFMILLLTGWLSVWKQSINPRLKNKAWVFLLLQFFSAQLIYEPSAVLAVNIGGFLFPAAFALLFVQKKQCDWFRTPAAMILISISLWFFKECIRMNPVFWIIPETWAAGILVALFSFLIGRTLSERWVLLTSSLFLGELAFSVYHLSHFQFLQLGDEDFQSTWWHGIWIGLWFTYFPFYWAKCKHLLSASRKVFLKRNLEHE